MWRLIATKSLLKDIKIYQVTVKNLVVKSLGVLLILTLEQFKLLPIVLVCIFKTIIFLRLNNHLESLFL